ncbi:hypothetical protein ACV35C_30490, partial [Pseudomonas aeruginosa]
GLDPRLVPALHLCQGRYFSYSGRSPFRHLVYPMPEARTAGLGIHATLDLGGQAPMVDAGEVARDGLGEGGAEGFVDAVVEVVHVIHVGTEAQLAAGLGIHATLDLGGQLRFGPDLNYVDNLDYRLDESLRPAFAQAISRHFPGI